MSKFRVTPFARRTAIAALTAAALTLFVAATPAKPARWSATVSVNSIGAYVVGNPRAKVKLVEYFSYTCSHCADFAKLGSAPLKAQYIDKGLVLFEYRNLVRDPVDLTAALLARCGPVGAFAGNHEAIFAAQPVWLKRVEQASDALKASWYQGDPGTRARKIAADAGLAALMEKRGYSAAQVNACLDSEVAQAEVTGMTNIGLSGDHVRGTPTFFVNGRDAETTTWPVLKTKLDAALKGS